MSLYKKSRCFDIKKNPICWYQTFIFWISKNQSHFFFIKKPPIFYIKKLIFLVSKNRFDIKKYRINSKTAPYKGCYLWQATINEHQHFLNLSCKFRRLIYLGWAGRCQQLVFGLKVRYLLRYSNETSYTHSPWVWQGCVLLILRSKGQGHGALIIENGFQTKSDAVIYIRSWNFIHFLPVSQRCALLILRSKGEGHGALMINSFAANFLSNVFSQCHIYFNM